MTPAPTTIRFTARHLAAFLDFSRDHNPLHADPGYASRTPFGEVVVPGMCAVISALTRIHGTPWRRVRGVFQSPIFLDRDYHLAIAAANTVTTLSVSRGTTAVAEITAFADPDTAPFPTAVDPIAYRAGRTQYEPNAAALTEFFELSGGGVLAPDRVTALAWASYFVGMVYPGPQALFSSFDLSFDAGPSARWGLVMERLAATLDDRFHRVTVHGESNGPLRSVALQAFVRPERVAYSMSDIAAAAAGAGDWFRGKGVVVSGGTRGFGSVLTRALLLAGSRVLFTYHRSDEDARAIAADARRHNARAIACQVDLTAPHAADALREGAGALGGIDLVISNATLPIRPEPFVDQSPADVAGYIARSAAMSAAFYHALVPLIAPGGIAVSVSSSYAVRPQPGFSHYISAKMAIEGMTRVLAVEHPEIRFVIARPGRMLTDQTNVPISLEPSLSAIDVAGRLLREVAALATRERVTPSDVVEIDLSGS